MSIAGVVTASRTRTTRNNSLMAYVTLEDNSGSMELLLFSRTLEECSQYIKDGVAVVATGRISIREEKEPQLMTDSVRPIESVKASMPPPVEGKQKLYILVESREDPWLERIQKLLVMFPGREQLHIKLEEEGKWVGLPCVVHPALVAQLREWLGEEHVVLK